MRLVRRTVTPPGARLWGAELRPLLEAVAGPPAPRPRWQPWQVLGGPGTGKTSLLVDLAAGRIAAGADPESVLVLTHAKHAAAAVRDAVTARLSEGGPTAGGVPGASREPLVRTVHSYAFAVLRRHATAHGNPPPRLLTGAEQDAVLREMLRGDLADIAAGARHLWPPRLHPALGLDGFAQQLRDLMLRATERGLGPEDLERIGREHDREEWIAAGRFLQRYEQSLLLRWSVGVEAPEATAPALDAAELVGACLDALATDADLLADERARLRYLFVDDAQHLDPQAALLVRVVGAAAHTVVVTGDPDQAVFTFRGADTRFAADPGAPEERRIVLRENHRSAPGIRLVTDRIAAALPGSAPHRVAPGPAAPGESGAVRVRVLATPAKEAALIADHLRRAHLTGGVPWSRMAVIVRSVPLSLAPLRRALLAAGVPVRQPTLDAPLARRRGAAWMLLALRALLAADRPGASSVAIFSAEDALDLLAGPLGGADQITLRRLRRGIRRAMPTVRRGAAFGYGERESAVVADAEVLGTLAAAALVDFDAADQEVAVRPMPESARTATARASDAVEEVDSAGRPGAPGHGDRPARDGDAESQRMRSRSDGSPAGGSPGTGVGDTEAGEPEETARAPLTDDAEWREIDAYWGLEVDETADDAARQAGVRPGSLEPVDPQLPGRSAAAGVRVAGSGPGAQVEVAQPPLLDQSSAEVLRGLLVGGGDRAVLDGLTEVEAAPLRRVLHALDRARAARERGASLEDVLWALWTASRLERRWVAQSERGGAVGMQADRDLDAAVGLFDAAAAYVDRLPRAGIEGFVDYISQQEIPHDSRPLTPPAEEVALLSAHAAAGREWDVVAVAGVQEGIWPNTRPRGTLLHTEELVDLLAGVGGAGEYVSRSAPILAEERRLLLVACGRARRSLLVTAVESASGDRDLVPSRFLTELLGRTEDSEPGVLPVVDPGRALVMHSLVAELRGVVCDPDAEPARRRRAAHQLARLADAGVPGTAPEEWYGTAELSTTDPLWDEDEAAVALSPSTVELLRTCPLRWALERHGGTDGNNPHAVKGSLVHTLVQALAGRVPVDQVRAALDKAWRAVDPGDGWHSRQERRRTEAMLETFMAWVRNTRGELTQAGVEVPVDCVLPARSPDERPVRIRGRVDRLERDEQGRFVIIDVKTGKNPISKQAAADHAQLATYQVAAAAGALDGPPDGDPAPAATESGSDSDDYGDDSRAAEPDTSGSLGEPGGARLVYVAKSHKTEGATQRMQDPLDAQTLRDWRDTIHDAAAATKGPSYLAMRNDGCRHCSVAGSCPVQDAGRQVTDE
ncbi:ATP-dependent helicase [Nocardia higoensis]|uniref:ATP-dependent helicase n=1 Tax=Nocardia higoensis TaxID=228599 RepID=UPI0002EBE4B2|nr:PD-(D/E)XK nuclease family protein [Nocardia higoensis]